MNHETGSQAEICKQMVPEEKSNKQKKTARVQLRH